MMRIRTSIYLLGFTALVACNHDNALKTIKITNPLSMDRSEIVAVSLSALGQERSFHVKSGDDFVLSQLVDYNRDSIPDELLFQAQMGPNESKIFTLTRAEGQNPIPETRTYSRFVPERIDDYAWENDLVAFRTYGPEAQRLVDNGEPGGTLSSGIDCWLKRVAYPVIDTWYTKYTNGGTYHKDDGEGYDPYHVGKSRGCGGIGVWLNDSLFVSKNFVSHRKIAEGPLRTIFELTYAPWQVNGISIKERKIISLDLGNQLSKVDVVLSPSETIPNVTIGLTLHDQSGNVYADSVKGVYSYWEKIDDSELGTAVLFDPSDMLAYTDFRSQKPDMSHLYVHAKPADTVSYYAGFAWRKAGKITTHEQWNDYLVKFADRNKNPLVVTVE